MATLMAMMTSSNVNAEADGLECWNDGGLEEWVITAALLSVMRCSIFHHSFVP
jgi:hypothetical protein